MKNHLLLYEMSQVACQEMADKKTNQRVTVIFSEDAAAWLAAHALARSITVSDLLRRIVDEVRGAYIVPRPQR